jgi:hypothetical protein
MVPGLVTVEDKKGRRQNLYPVDAKELLNAQGDEYKLVENGAIEAARLAATPLRSGMAANIPDDHIVAEVSGIAGRVVVGENAKDAEKIRQSGENDGEPVKAKGPTSASEQDAEKAKQSAAQGDGKKAEGQGDGKAGQSGASGQK